MFFTPSTIPLPPEGGTMADERADVRDTMVPPSGVRGTPAKNTAINIPKNLKESYHHVGCRRFGFSTVCSSGMRKRVSEIWIPRDSSSEGEGKSVRAGNLS